MKIIIDLQAAQNDSSFRGVGRYCKSLAKEMTRKAVDRGHEVWLLLNGNFPASIQPLTSEFDELVPVQKIAIFPSSGAVTETIPQNLPRLRAAEIAREKFIADLQPDVVHLSSLFEGSVDDAVASVGKSGITMPTAITLYDLIPLVLKELYITSPEYATFYYSKLDSLKNADLLLAISEHSRREAIDLLGFEAERIINISAAVDPMFQVRQYTHGDAQAILSKHGIIKPFLLYVPGGFDPRKNFDNLLTAFAQLPLSVRDAHQLVIGSNVQQAERNGFMHKVLALGLRETDVVLTGYVRDEELIGLYNLCRLHVFPSLYEGFGLPALEAMACGAPSIGSNTSSLPEVLGRADALFDPRSVDSISKKIMEVLTDEAFRACLRAHAIIQARGFSWARSAQLALEKLEYDFDAAVP